MTRRTRLTKTKEKQKMPQAQPLVAKQLQQRQLALLQPRQKQEQAEQEGQPWHERLVPVDGGLQRQKLPSPERGQNDNDLGKTREFNQRDGKASYLPRRRRARWNLKDIAQIPWCANYVCSENNRVFLAYRPACLKFSATKQFLKENWSNANEKVYS